MFFKRCSPSGTYLGRYDALHLVINGAGNPDPSWFRKLFEPRRDVDRVASGAITNHHNFTRMDPDTV